MNTQDEKFHRSTEAAILWSLEQSYAHEEMVPRHVDFELLTRNRNPDRFFLLTDYLKLLTYNPEPVVHQHYRNFCNSNNIVDGPGVVDRIFADNPVIPRRDRR